MTVRLPIFGKIVLWFFVNVALLALAGWIVLRVQLKPGMSSFLGGYVGQRVEPVARRLIADLEAAPQEQWDAIVGRTAAAHGLQIVLMDIHHQRLAGPEMDVVETVRQRMPKGPPRGPGGLGPRGAGRPAREEGADGPPTGMLADGPNGMEERPPRPAGGAPAGKAAGPPLPVHQQFFIRTENPDAYWAGLLMAMRTGDGPGRPVVFLARADTFSAGGLFFDFTPWILLGAGLVMLSVLIWLPLVRDLTHAIRQMTQATSQVADGQFDVRVDERRGDELGQLGGSINRMTGRLDGFVTGQKRFLGDIAHELCSPIARLQMALGILEQRADERQRPYLEDVREEVQHMSNLVNELLSFSKASLKPAEVKLSPVNLKAAAELAARREAADGGEVRINVPPDLHALANAELLQRALSNLVRNALRYAGHAGPIDIAARRDGPEVRLSVADRGPGIPKGHVEKVFETFYRIEADRGRETGGVGLGLAIVRASVEACGGTVRARNRAAGGLRVIIYLKHTSATPQDPAAPPDDQSMAQVEIPRDDSL
jgi:two-component system, OmpR family, sensor histidine kinase CpxA